MQDSKALKVRQVPVPSDDHPPPPYPQLMKHEFTLGLIAPKGCGKTTVICNMLAFYKEYFHTILVFSPTIQSDEKWDWVKNQKLLTPNKPLQKWIKDMSEQRKKNAVVQPAPISFGTDGPVNPEEGFTGYIPEECFFDDYDDETFMNIMEEQKSMINLLKKHGKSKYLANRILIIFDDLVGSSLFAGSRGSYFKGREFLVNIFRSEHASPPLLC